MAKVTILKRDEEGADMTDLEALLESVRSIVEAHADDELSDDERELMLSQTFQEYRTHTGGRDGLADIAATQKSERTQAMQDINLGALAMFALQCKAAELRKADPSLSEEQAFSKAYVAPENHEAMKAERQASRARLVAGYAVARTAPQIIDPDDDDDIARMIAEIRRDNPFLTDRELYDRIRDSIEERGHLAGFRSAMNGARRDGASLPSPQAVEVAKRDDAMSELFAKADELRKVMPALTREQAFEKVFRSEPALAASERAASRSALYS
jgi:hypothetical protein